MERKHEQTKKQTKKEKENGKQKENRKTRLKVKPLNVKSTNKRKEKIIEILDKRYAQKSDILKILEELRLQRESSDRKFEQMREESERRFQEFREDMERRFKEFREDMEKRFQALYRRFEAIDRRFEQIYDEIKRIRQDMHNTISAIGSRWGVAAERAFREGLKEILGKYFNADVKEIYVEDKEGIVKGRPGKYQAEARILGDVEILTSPQNFKP